MSRSRQITIDACLSAVFASPIRRTRAAVLFDFVATQLRLDVAHRRLASGTAWAFSGTAGYQGLALFSAAIAARILGPERFGEFGVVNSTLGLFGSLAGFGLGLTATKYVAEFWQSDPVRARRIVTLTSLASIFMGVISVAVIWIAAPGLAAAANAPALASPLRLGAALLLFSAVNTSQAGTLAGLEAFRVSAASNLARGLLLILLTLLLVPFWGLEGALIAVVLAFVLTAVLNAAAVLRMVQHIPRPTIAAVWSERSLLYQFSTPSLLTTAMLMPGMWVATALLAHQPGGYAQIGIFMAADQFRSVITFLPLVLGQPSVSLLSNALGNGDLRTWRKLMRTNLLLVLGATSAIAAGLILAAPLLVRVFGKEFLAAAPLLLPLGIAGVANSVRTIVGHGLASLGRMWLNFSLAAGWAAALVAFALALVPRHAAMGLALAFMFSQLLQALAAVLVAGRLIRRL